MVVVGRGTFEADAPSLDARLEGHEHFSPRRAILTKGAVPAGWERLGGPAEIADLANVNELLVEGGAGAAAAFLAADLVDRLLVYRAPILIGDGKSAVGGMTDFTPWAIGAAPECDRRHALGPRLERVRGAARAIP